MIVSVHTYDDLWFMSLCVCVCVCIAAQASVFKGCVRRRREEVQGAEEVLENENTAVDLPVDQV